jgi:hypothetical protein
MSYGFDEKQLQIDFEKAILRAIKNDKERFDNHVIIKALIVIDEDESNTKIVSNLQRFVKTISSRACEASGVKQTNLDVFNVITKKGDTLTIVEIVFMNPVSQTSEKPAIKTHKTAKRSSIVKIILRTVKKRLHYG